MSDRLLTATDVADFLCVMESWVRGATRDGRLPHLRLGRYRRYRPADILQDPRRAPSDCAGSLIDGFHSIPGERVMGSTDRSVVPAQTRHEYRLDGLEVALRPVSSSSRPVSLRNAWRDAVRDSDLPAPAKLIALVLGSYMNQQGVCWPSVRRVATGASLSRSTVHKHLRTHLLGRWLRADATHGRSTRYHARFPSDMSGSRTGEHPGLAAGVQLPHTACPAPGHDPSGSRTRIGLEPDQEPRADEASADVAAQVAGDANHMVKLPPPPELQEWLVRMRRGVGREGQADVVLDILADARHHPMQAEDRP